MTSRPEYEAAHGVASERTAHRWASHVRARNGLAHTEAMCFRIDYRTYDSPELVAGPAARSR